MPNEILVTIFENLDSTDISRCSWVNMRWKNVIESKFGTNDLVKFLIKFRNPRLLATPSLLNDLKVGLKFKGLPIDTEAKLDACVELILEKVRFQINSTKNFFYHQNKISKQAILLFKKNFF